MKKGLRKSSSRQPRLQDTVRLSAAGLAKVLGDLEARVMRAVWQIGTPAPARAVHERVQGEHDVALLTVVTVLNKLTRKGLLARRQRGGLLHYEARMSHDAFLAHASRRVVEGILALAPQAVAASFVDVVADRSPEQLAELQRLIRRRMKEGGRGD
jgi:predicted transcriptional regulator